MDSLQFGFGVLVFLVALALAFDFMNGFHDAANSIATIVSSPAAISASIASTSPVAAGSCASVKRSISALASTGARPSASATVDRP